MDFNDKYYTDPSVLHIGCEAPRAYFIPYESQTVHTKIIALLRRNFSHFAVIGIFYITEQSNAYRTLLPKISTSEITSLQSP